MSEKGGFMTIDLWTNPLLLLLFLPVGVGCAAKTPQVSGEDILPPGAAANALSENGLPGDSNVSTFSADGLTLTAVSSSFAKGADVSWLPMMESYGYKWLNDAGQAQDALMFPQFCGLFAYASGSRQAAANS
jgi:hypothetical protein